MLQIINPTYDPSFIMSLGCGCKKKKVAETKPKATTKTNKLKPKTN